MTPPFASLLQPNNLEQVVKMPWRFSWKMSKQTSTLPLTQCDPPLEKSWLRLCYYILSHHLWIQAFKISFTKQADYSLIAGFSGPKSYPVESDLFKGECYLPFEQLGHGGWQMQYNTDCMTFRLNSFSVHNGYSYPWDKSLYIKYFNNLLSYPPIRAWVKTDKSKC